MLEENISDKKTEQSSVFNKIAVTREVTSQQVLIKYQQQPLSLKPLLHLVP